MADYTELVKELRYCVDGDEECAGCKRYGQMSCEVYLMEEAADAIEELEAAVPTWIPVTERLPKKRKWVLCRCEADIIEVLRWENNEWYHDPMHVYYPSFVTHWMPLPEPPKEET